MGAGDIRHDILRGRLTALDICSDTSEPQNHQAVGDVEHLLKVVTDQHYSQPLVLEPSHQIEDLALLGYPERGRRLVEQDYL
jgi:hypothetical protein